MSGKKISDEIILVAIIFYFLIGFLAGYLSYPDPGWDILKDPRSCIIEWDDGTFSYKTKIHKLGDLGPGESIIIPENIIIEDLPRGML
jgi:hypothetical protein